MALCGISTVTFLRLCTRAPRTRRTSRSPAPEVVSGVVSVVAKGKLRQQAWRGLPKLQIIRPQRCRGKSDAERGRERLWLLLEIDVANAAVNIQTNRARALAIGFVPVFAVLFLQSVNLDGADGAGNGSGYTDVFGKAHAGVADSTFEVGGQIGLARAGKVEINFPGPEMNFEAGHVDTAEAQIALSGAHVDPQFERSGIAEIQIPGVIRMADVRAAALLVDSQIAGAIGDVILNAGLFPTTGVAKIGFEEMRRTAANIQLAGIHVDRSADAFRALQVHGFGGMTRTGDSAVPIAMSTDIISSVPKQEYKN